MYNIVNKFFFKNLSEKQKSSARNTHNSLGKQYNGFDPIQLRQIIKEYLNSQKKCDTIRDKGWII